MEVIADKENAYSKLETDKLTKIGVNQRGTTNEATRLITVLRRFSRRRYGVQELFNRTALDFYRVFVDNQSMAVNVGDATIPILEEYLVENGFIRL